MLVMHVLNDETEEETTWVIHDDFQVVQAWMNHYPAKLTIEHGGTYQNWDFYLDSFERVDAQDLGDWGQAFSDAVFETTDEWIIRNTLPPHELPKWNPETEEWEAPKIHFPNPQNQWELDYNRMKLQKQHNPEYDGENPAAAEYSVDRADRTR